MEWSAVPPVSAAVFSAVSPASFSFCAFGWHGAFSPLYLATVY